MDNRRITKFIILVFTILFADVVKELVLHFFNITKNPNQPLRSVAIGMIVSIAVFYPIFTAMDVVLEKMVSSYVRGTKRVAGGSNKGLFVSFIIGVAILFALYLYAWFDIKFWNLLFKF